ncbi:hypothetical protein [Streptomyces griseomycini]|uniref:Uncharacterized protein n=1 Tax=Streptomyces griseomycini TaxID=66895 RepID=A0A7W7VA89_9ACTN|nr:hypothetical protein [Streptomyces griseomycini]MBB4902592.1 hypothetical protein [Streptomyces griseomycini]GGR54348.1 hypothetical protein GCM10015536_69630 [Streptomyces griseomycini]
MATKTGIDTVPTDYQARLLLAALADPQHRIPSDARGRTLDIMLSRQWIRPRRLTSSLAFVKSGVRDWVLTHHGVNAANKVKAAQGSGPEKRTRVVDVEGIGWTCERPGRKWTAEYEGVKFELERRTRNVADGCPDTGWYLYGGSHFGEYMAAGFKEAATAAFPYVCPKEGHPQPAAEVQALAERFPAGSPAIYVPEGSTERDVVVVNSGPDQDGTVEVLSMQQGGKALRVPLAALEELPELPPEPEGEITDWWTITDAQGAELTRVQAEDDPRARKAAMRHAAVVAAVRRDKGFAVRRLRTSELSVPVGELRGVPRFPPAPAVQSV